MKLFGHSGAGDGRPLELSEISIQTSPEQFRQIAVFLKNCADGIEADSDWEHEHFNDEFDVDNGPDPIVVRDNR